MIIDIHKYIVITKATTEKEWLRRGENWGPNTQGERDFVWPDEDNGLPHNSSASVAGPLHLEQSYTLVT